MNVIGLDIPDVTTEVNNLTDISFSPNTNDWKIDNFVISTRISTL